MEPYEFDAVAPSTGALGDALGEMKTLAAGFSAELAEAASAMRSMDGEARRLSSSLGSSLRSAFDKAVFGGAKLGDVLRDLGRDVAGSALDAALKPVQSALGSGLSSLMSGFTGSITSLLGFEKGGAFSAGRVRAFANGGVVDGPTLFPMRSGTGLMGEAGPEAIMPLTRGADGKLGVMARGASGGPNVTVNITTPDIAGFQQSRGQIAAQLARAVQRGSKML